MDVKEDSSLLKSKWLRVVVEEHERSQSKKCEEARNRAQIMEVTQILKEETKVNDPTWEMKDFPLPAPGLIERFKGQSGLLTGNVSKALNNCHPCSALMNSGLLL